MENNTVGNGSPFTWHINVVESSSETVVFTGPWIIRGGTIQQKLLWHHCNISMNILCNHLIENLLYVAMYEIHTEFEYFL